MPICSKYDAFNIEIVFIMKRLIYSIVAFVLGVLVFCGSIYFAWASSSPCFNSETYQLYQFYSMVLGYVSIILMLGGVVFIVKSIRKMNIEYKESTRKAD